MGMCTDINNVNIRTLNIDPVAHTLLVHQQRLTLLQVISTGMQLVPAPHNLNNNNWI